MFTRIQTGLADVGNSRGISPILAVVEAVITVFPANRVGVRLSPNGVYNDMGSPDYRETFLYVAQKLNSYELAYLHILDGLAFGFHEFRTAHDFS